MSSQPTKRSHWPLTILSGATSLLNLAIPLLLVRWIAADQVGVYKIFFLYLSTVPWILLSAGLMNGLFFWGGQGGKIWEEAFGGTYLVQGLLAIVVGGVGFLLRQSLAHLLGWQTEWMTLLIFSLAVAFVQSFCDEAWIARGRIWRGAIFASAFELIRTLAIVVAAMSGAGVTVVLMAHLAVTLLKALVGGMLVFTKHRLRFPSFAILRRVVAYAAPVSGAGFFSILIHYSDQFVLSGLLAPAQFALYSLGCLTVPPIASFEQSVNKVLIPELGAALRLGKKDEARRLFRDATGELLLWILPAVVGLFVFADAIIVMLFTEKYRDAAIYLKFFAWDYLIFAVPFDSWARALGESRWIFKLFASFGVLSVLLTAVGVHFFGAWGALGALLLSGFSLRIYGLVAGGKKLGTSWKQLWPWRRFYRIVMVLVPLASLCFVIRDRFASDLVWFFVMGPVFSIVYLGFLFSGFMRPASHRPTSKVLQLTQYLNLGGLERLIFNLSISLKNEKLSEPTVMVYDALPETPTLDEHFKASGLSVVRFEKGPGFSLRLAWRILKYCRANGISVIHAHDSGPGIYACLAKLLSGWQISVVYTQHSLVHLSKRRRQRFYEFILGSIVDELCVVNPDYIEFYQKMGALKKARYVQNGVDFGPIASPFDFHRDAARRRLLESMNLPGQIKSRLISMLSVPWVLCLGRVHPGKGQRESLDLWSRLPKDRSALLIFVGAETESGELSLLQERISTTAQLADSVLYAGSTDRPMEWLLACDVLLSGSRFEGLPLSAIEAIGTGMRTVLSDIPGHHEFRSNAELFDLEKPEAGARILANTLSKIDPLTEDESRGSRWERTAGLRQEFGLTQLARRYSKIYRGEAK